MKNSKELDEKVCKKSGKKTRQERQQELAGKWSRKVASTHAGKVSTNEKGEYAGKEAGN